MIWHPFTSNALPSPYQNRDPAEFVSLLRPDLNESVPSFIWALFRVFLPRILNTILFIFLHRGDFRGALFICCNPSLVRDLCKSTRSPGTELIYTLLEASSFTPSVVRAEIWHPAGFMNISDRKQTGALICWFILSLLAPTLVVVCLAALGREVSC